MKISDRIKATVIILGVYMLVVLFSSSTASSGTSDDKKISSIPDTVMMVFEKACTGCHCDEGNSLAKGKLNFDKWGSLTAAKRLAKAQDICKELKNGSMPPKKFRTNNPDLVPVQAETDRVCAWVASIER